MIKDAASEQRNSTGPATSSGLPQRARAVRAEQLRGPGRIVLERLRQRSRDPAGGDGVNANPFAAQASASDRVSCAIPPLLAL